MWCERGRGVRLKKGACLGCKGAGSCQVGLSNRGDIMEKGPYGGERSNGMSGADE